MKLLPQDALVALKLALHPGEPTLAQLATDLGMSGSQVHYAIQRCRVAGLVLLGDLRVNVPNLLEFLIHGVRYAFPAELGPVTRGVLTAHSAPSLRADVLVGDDEVVWPDPEGDARGASVAPLHKSVPQAALRDPGLYAALALVDAIRVGRVRVRGLAASKLEELLGRGTLR